MTERLKIKINLFTEEKIDLSPILFLISLNNNNNTFLFSLQHSLLGCSQCCGLKVLFTNLIRKSIAKLKKKIDAMERYM